ncbi:hypothetical protein [Halorhodospira sp. 9622]|uniref:hypothetical protein n=1 Tax=Halorhodospira sp. 9622 TaxID=2899136 RepID=UPI001EE81B3D|nr:hypothetical protein [Halorhodospira sp. 9622]MCG5538891.1 hypothetical protein [Halorhodospira sp. 9622]
MNRIRNGLAVQSIIGCKMIKIKTVRQAMRSSSVKMVPGCLMGMLTCAPAMAQLANPWEADGAEIQMELSVDSFVELELLDSALLRLKIPPPASTIPAEGVGFRVIGNASATVTAEPDDFVKVDGPEDWLGKATLGSEEIGYAIELRFPRFGQPSSPVQISTLPGFEPGPTTPGLTVDLTQTGYEREGVIHLEANENWTVHGGIPSPGVYTGHVTITVSADAL